MNGAGEGNRTLVTSLEDWRSTIELRPQRGARRRRNQRDVKRKDAKTQGRIRRPSAQGNRQSLNVSKRQARRGPSLQAGHRGGDRWAANPKGRGDKAVAGCGDEHVPTPTLSAALGFGATSPPTPGFGATRAEIKAGGPAERDQDYADGTDIGGGKLIPQSGTDMLKSKANVQGPKPKVKGDEGRVRFRRGRGR